MERIDETTHPNKEAFYSEFYLQSITDDDYIHAQKVFKEFEIKILGEYHDQSDTLLLGDVFGNFVCTCISMASLFKKDRSKIKTINRC